MDEQTIILIGIAFIIVIDKGLNMLRSRGIDLPKIARQIDELHKWHAKEDDDGVKVWYVRRSLEDTLKTLADNIAHQTNILQEIHREQIELFRQLNAKQGD